MTHFATLYRPPSSLCAFVVLALALFIVALSPALSGCGTAAPATSPGTLQDPALQRTSASGRTQAGVSASRVARALREETADWQGTPYRLGGTTRRGIDCSALMQHIYRDALGVTLSRSTRSQVREGQRVQKSNLRPGDLVFFRTGGKGRHVGVYVGEDEFAHASASAGPTVSSLSLDYWEDAYWTARRVLRLPASPAAEPAPARAATPPRPAANSERAGW